MGSAISKVSYTDKLESLLEQFHSELMLKLNQHQQSVDQFSQCYLKWLNKRNEVILSFQSAMKDIEEHHRNVNIASLTGSSVSLAGNAACIAGLLLAPVTGGLSVALSIGGIIGSAAGSITSGGARVVEVGLKHSAMKDLGALTKDHCQETLELALRIESCSLQEKELLHFMKSNKSLQSILNDKSVQKQVLADEKIKQIWTSITNGSASLCDYYILLNYLRSDHFSVLKSFQKLKLCTMDVELIEKSVRLCLSLRSLVVEVCECAEMLKNFSSGVSAVQVVSKGSRLAKGALVGLSMAVDVYDICSTAHEMITKTSSEDLKSLSKVISTLEKQREEVKKFYAHLKSLYRD